MLSKEEIAEVIQEYRDKLDSQAAHIRSTQQVHDVDSASLYLKKWFVTQVFTDGVMKGKTISAMKMCALLSHVIEPTENSDFSINTAPHAWSIYWASKKQGVL